MAVGRPEKVAQEASTIFERRQVVANVEARGVRGEADLGGGVEVLGSVTGFFSSSLCVGILGLANLRQPLGSLLALIRAAVEIVSKEFEGLFFA
jgi:hypothetical protein